MLFETAVDDSDWRAVGTNSSLIRLTEHVVALYFNVFISIVSKLNIVSEIFIIMNEKYNERLKIHKIRTNYFQIIKLFCFHQFFIFSRCTSTSKRNVFRTHSQQLTACPHKSESCFVYTHARNKYVYLNFIHKIECFHTFLPQNPEMKSTSRKFSIQFVHTISPLNLSIRRNHNGAAGKTHQNPNAGRSYRRCRLLVRRRPQRPQSRPVVVQKADAPQRFAPPAPPLSVSGHDQSASARL